MRAHALRARAVRRCALFVSVWGNRVPELSCGVLFTGLSRREPSVQPRKCRCPSSSCMARGGRLKAAVAAPVVKDPARYKVRAPNRIRGPPDPPLLRVFLRATQPPRTAIRIPAADRLSYALPGCGRLPAPMGSSASLPTASRSCASARCARRPPCFGVASAAVMLTRWSVRGVRVACAWRLLAGPAFEL